MRIVIWKIKEKKSEKSPDYQGYIDDGTGKKTNIVLWVRKSEKGNTYLSGKKDTKKYYPSQQDRRPEQKPDFEPKKEQKFDFDVDDDLPF